MEQTKNELQLVSNMIMCGDHPSITKTELNAKESKSKEEEKDKDFKKFISYGRISPTSSQTDKPLARSRTVSEHALRALQARRRAHSIDLAERADVDVQGNRALLQAAIGSFRWPPYLLCVWVLVLVLTHLLHCLVGVLEKALPNLRKFCEYFRTWTEASWRAESELNRRVCPIALACVTGALYALYYALYLVYALAVWAIEPLCSDVDALSATDVPKVTNYEEINSKVNLNTKP